MTTASPLPRISVVTPSYNQAAFLEQTIRSVLDQDYPNLQYGIVDGGSTDGSIEILERYRQPIERSGGFIIIEPDRGQADAINKGLQRADGDWVGWLCSDDLLLPGALTHIGRYAAGHTNATWLAGGVQMTDVAGQPREIIRPRGDFTLAGVMLRNPARPFDLPQPGNFWRRSLHDRLGLLRNDLHYCMDFEWWLRLLRDGQRPALLDTELAAYRLHDTSKTCAQPEGFLREHLLVEDAYTRHLSRIDRLRMVRRMGYRRRAYAVRCGDGQLRRHIARRPWWLLSQQVRAALRADPEPRPAEA